MVTDLNTQVDELKEKLTKSRSTKSSGMDFTDALEDELENERKKWKEKLRKELAAKDRQIESLEDQLRHATNLEIKKMRRGTDKGTMTSRVWQLRGLFQAQSQVRWRGQGCGHSLLQLGPTRAIGNNFAFAHACVCMLSCCVFGWGNGSCR